MRKILLTIALMGTLMCNAQKGENFYDKIKVDVSAGYATKGFLAGNVGVSIDKWLVFANFQINIDPPTRGRRYTGIINSNEYSSEIQGTGSYYTGIYGIGIGYFFTNNFEMGTSLEYASNRQYENRFNKDYILSESGYYYIDNSDGGRLSSCAHVSYYFKPSMLGRPYVRLAYDNCSKLTFMVGLKFDIIPG